jgi:hypothetical protein
MANIERMNYFKTIRDPKELDEIPTDVLKELYLQTVTDLDEFKKEHNIMKRFIYTNGLWNRFLNYDAFIDHLRDDNIAKEVIKKC